MPWYWFAGLLPRRPKILAPSTSGSTAKSESAVGNIRASSYIHSFYGAGKGYGRFRPARASHEKGLALLVCLERQLGPERRFLARRLEEVK